MEYNRSSAREKWTIMMYMRDFELMSTYAYALRASNQLSNDNIDGILKKMEEEGIYNPRNGGSTFTGQFKSIQIAWYMYGYYKKSRSINEDKKMVFTPLGNLLLDNLKDKIVAAKIFLTMLYGNGFRQPFSQMDARFNLYPFRLIFKLLRDERLSYRLYSDEVFYLVMFCKTINEDTYEELVADIVKLRGKNSIVKFNEYKKNQRVLGLSCHEWRYAVGMLESARIVNVKNEHGNRVVGKLEYGKIDPKTGRHTASRSYREDYIELRPELMNLTNSLLESYAFYDKPYPDDELSTVFNSDRVVELYSFYPKELLEELGIATSQQKAIANMLDIARSVKYYGHMETETGANFEYALENAFNMFIDVEATRIAGAGNSDVECLYHKYNSIKKFDLEAKSTKTKLASVIPKRLRKHRLKIGADYTLIVTPNFSIGVLDDINNEDTAIIRSATLSNYLYQYITKSGRNISYSVLNEIIENNLGNDITELVNEYVYSNFGHGTTDLSIKKSNKKIYYDDYNTQYKVADNVVEYK